MGFRVNTEKSKYLKKMVKIYTTITFLAIFITCIIAYIYIARQEKESEGLREDANFTQSVEAFEKTHQNLEILGNELKNENAFSMFILINDNSFYNIINVLIEKIDEIHNSYSFLDIEMYAYREDIDMIVSRKGTQTLEESLQDWKVSNTQFVVAAEYLKYSEDTDYCIITDDSLFYMSTRTISDNLVYVICKKDIADIYENLDGDIYFWENAQNVQDLRENVMPTEISNQQFFYMPSTSDGEITIHDTEEAQLRLYKSAYFDILYCGVDVKNSTEVVIGYIVTAIFIFIFIYFVLYFIIYLISMFMYRPIDRLIHFMNLEFINIDLSNNEFAVIMEKIQSLKQENKELKQSLELFKVREKENAILVEQEKLISNTEQFDLPQPENTKIFSDTENNENELKEKMAQYIIDHISQDIGLRDISEDFGLSFAYMSTLFKNTMQMNFKEYVSYQRYLYSLEIMKANPKMKISDVAASVGIVNINTYIRIFKKYNDSTPKQYMSMLECTDNNYENGE